MESLDLIGREKAAAMIRGTVSSVVKAATIDD